MSQVIHKLINKDGKYVQLPPYRAGEAGYGNLAIPSQFTESAIQEYPLGTRLVVGDRVYRYCKYGAACARTVNAAFSVVDMFEADVNTYGAAVAGDTTIEVDGASAGSPVKDAWAGGYLSVLGSSQTYRTIMQIISNKAATATDPYPVELTLEQPLPFDLGDNVSCTIFPNLYSDVRTMYAIGNGAYYTCVGWPARTISAANYYGWVQTWGPCFTNRAAEDLSAGGDRDLVVVGDGAVRVVDKMVNAGAATGESFQRVGFSLAINIPTAGNGCGWFYMQIAP